jgi:hypothetical protein
MTLAAGEIYDGEAVKAVWISEDDERAALVVNSGAA